MIISLLAVMAPAGASPDTGGGPVPTVAPGPLWTTSDVEGQPRDAVVDPVTGTVFVVGDDTEINNTALVAYSQDGDRLWRVTLSPSNPTQVAVDSRRGVVYVAGTAATAFVSAYTVGGQRLWRREAGPAGSSWRHLSVDDVSGQVFVTGSLNSSDGIVRTQALTRSGSVLWEDRYGPADGSPDGADRSALAMTLAPDARTLYLAGDTVRFGATRSSEGWLVAYDPADGSRRWQSTLVLGETVPRLVDLAVSADSTRVFGVGHYRFDLSTSGKRPLAVAYSSAGERLWSRTLSEPGELLSAVVEPTTNTLLALEQSLEGGEVGFPLRAVSFGSTGNQRWRKDLSGGSPTDLTLDPATGDAYFSLTRSFRTGETLTVYRYITRINALSARVGVIGRVPYVPDDSEFAPYPTFDGVVDLERRTAYLATRNFDITSQTSYWLVAGFTLPVPE